ncbi:MULTISPECIES: SDR family NAD(P)-dependent oxidoreductase [Actinoplanes]|uniref:SDR family NAD(P)-dependent oxidoreductase n=1 Tax=Actinoplanes TaxID=1865 RepID=UPI0005F2A447|nr:MULTISPECIES: SDR family NAD(P)-dependent oxidoreductase [Actinoplanes]GLY02247.1 short chain dehydrogenase [Actinoplanes sp. NBRC 101535]
MSRVLITGGASGLGAALTRLLTARGDRVLVTDLAEEHEVPDGAVYQRLDVTSGDDWDAARKRVTEEFGGLDLLVNNAGVAAAGRIEKLNEAHWRRVLDINVLGAVTGCRTFTPLLKKQESGHIVTIASLAGLAHPAAMSSYNVSKAAVVALAESLRHELGPWHIDVSVVCPSFFRSDLAASLGGGDVAMERIAGAIIARAPLSADEMAVRVLAGIDSRKPLILPDGPARKAFWTKRLARRVYDRQMMAGGARLRKR